MVVASERRQSGRLDVKWPVCIWHSALGRFVMAETKDISRGGLSVSVPMSVPFTPGQEVEVDFPHGLPGGIAASLKPKRARVAHVCKEQTATSGQQIVGLALLEGLA